MGGRYRGMNGAIRWKRLSDFLAKLGHTAYNDAALGMSREPLRDLSRISGIGFTLVSYVLVFTGGGYLLDRLLGSDPWLMVGGVFVGAALGFVYMIRMVIAMGRDEHESADEKNGEDGAA